MKRFVSLLLSFILLFTASVVCISASSESATAQLQEMYAQAELLMAKGDYSGAATQFESLGAYSDASQMAMYCKGIMAAEDLGMFDVAISAFQSLGDFKDSKQLVTYYQGRSYQAVADELIESEEQEDIVKARDAYDEAAKVYSGLALFKDCLTRLSACQSGSDDALEKIHAYDYAAADALEKAGKYEEAINAFRKLGSYRDCEERIELLQNIINARIYSEAEALVNQGNVSLIKAYNIYKSLNGYSDSADRARDLLEKIKNDFYVKFGSYEQDNNTNNGKEDIDWIVLDIQEDKALLLSRYALDVHCYHNEPSDITWEKSNMRLWLNSKFLDSAFSKNERTAIMKTTVDNSKGFFDFKTNCGPNTNDYVFLLSFNEVHNVFSDYHFTCQPTEYVKAQGASVDEGNCLWWLRTNGTAQNETVFVYYTGDYSSTDIINWIFGVRPALWINLDADCFVSDYDEKAYEEADQLEQSGKYQDAIKAFEALGDYKDSAERALSLKSHHGFDTKNSVVVFGSYEQDNNKSNGKEPIEWIVLDVEGNKSLLISKYGLDEHPYHNDRSYIDWQACEMRTWLNRSFMHDAFNEEEQSALLSTRLNNSENQKASSNGNFTNDTIFLLSQVDLDKYFSGNSSLICESTSYARKQGAYYLTNDNCWWWLRGLGKDIASQYVDYEGSIQQVYMNQEGGCIRPAMWIDLTSNYFSSSK